MLTLLPLKPGAVVLALLALGACASDGTTPAPVALTSPAPAAPSEASATAQRGRAAQPEGSLANRMQFRTEVQTPATFVQQGRPGSLDYIPVGVTPQRTGVQRSAAELQAIEKELDAQRQRSRAYANRPKPASPYSGRPAPRLRPGTPAPGE